MGKYALLKMSSKNHGPIPLRNRAVFLSGATPMTSAIQHEPHGKPNSRKTPKPHANMRNSPHFGRKFAL